MEKILIGFIVVFVVIPVIFAISIYNKLIVLKNYTKEAFSTMDVYLKKRWDLIPNLVETAKRYMEHERETFEKIAELRSADYSYMNNKQKMQANAQLAAGLSGFFAVAENYPELKANENFIALTNELSNIENDIANSRKYYNGTVREYNTTIELFPNNIFAGMLNFKQEKLFEIEEAQRENVKVQF